MYATANRPTVVLILRRHFEPTLEMLRQAIEACPEELWDDRDEGPAFWQYAYHTLFWLDLWLSDSLAAFQAPPFHTRDALLEAGEAPSVTYPPQQLGAYLEQVYAKCALFFEGLTPDNVTQESEFFGRMWAAGDRILAQLRHIQHHVGHMNGLLKRRVGVSPGWVGYNE